MTETKTTKLLQHEDLTNGILVEPNQNLIINDVEAPKWWIEELASLLTPIILVAQPELMTDLLAPKLEKCEINVFPRQGGVRVLQSLDKRSPTPGTSFYVNTKRTSPQTSPSVSIDRRLRSAVLDMPYAKIQVIDDAICTGQTQQAVKRAIDWTILKSDSKRLKRETNLRSAPFEHEINFPEYFSAAWIRLLSNAQDISGFVQVVSGTTYKGTNGRPPLNSLSTLIDQRGKGKTVRESYAQKYSTEPARLIKLLKGGIR